MPNILVLIISSDGLPHYKKNRDVWRLYMNLYPHIHCYFIENSTDETRTYPCIQEDTLYLKGEESFENILGKTLNGMEYLLGSDHYDFIVRTNLSSVWCFGSLESYLESLPRTNVYSGPRGPYYHLERLHFWFYFVGGMGIIMSRDVCGLLLENRATAEGFKNMDDIDIGYTMHTLGIPILPIHYCPIESLSEFEEKKSSIRWDEPIFYRAKQTSGNRDEEPVYMEKIVRLVYSSVFGGS